MDPETAVKTYQCPGCSQGYFPKCFNKSIYGENCRNHAPGTFSLGPGLLFLGVEKGFNRLGPLSAKIMPLCIYKDEEQFRYDFSPQYKATSFKDNGLYDNFNVPVWKYLDENGNTFVRGLSPRINTPFLHIFLWDARDKIHCLEITKSDIESMD